MILEGINTKQEKTSELGGGTPQLTVMVTGGKMTNLSLEFRGLTVRYWDKFRLSMSRSEVEVLAADLAKWLKANI